MTTEPLKLPLTWRETERTELFNVLDVEGHLVFQTDSDVEAAFIVRACNSHGALVAASKRAFGRLTRLAQQYGTNESYGLGELQAALAQADPEDETANKQDGPDE